MSLSTIEEVMALETGEETCHECGLASPTALTVEPEVQYCEERENWICLECCEDCDRECNEERLKW